MAPSTTTFIDKWPTASTSASTASGSPSASPRASRLKGLSNDIPHPHFTRTYPASSSSTTFRVGDTVLIGNGLIPNQKWLQRPAPQLPKYAKGKGKQPAEYTGWVHQDGLEADDKLALIVGLYEDAAGVMMARVRWFARPGAVWGEDGPEEGEEPVPFEVYYTNDSTFLHDSRRNSKLAVSGKTALCTDTLTIKHITQHCIIHSPATLSKLLSPPAPTSAIKSDPAAVDGPPSQAPQQAQPVLRSTAELAAALRTLQAECPTFLVTQVYDAKPVEGAEFVGELDFDEVLERGRASGDWDTEAIMDEVEEEVILVEGKKKRGRPKKGAEDAGKKKIISYAELSDSEGSEDEDDFEGDSDESDSDGGSSGEEEGSNDEPATDDAADESEGEGSTTRKRRKRSDKDRNGKGAAVKRRKVVAGGARKVVPKMTLTAQRRAASRAQKRTAFKRKQSAIAAELSSQLPPAPNFASNESFKQLSAFEQAKALLHVSATPEVLPCRDVQRNQIKDLLGDAVLGQTGTCIYIHGVPGTGKTATVHSVVRELQQDEDMDPFQFVEINGMKIADPTSAFSLLWEHLSGHKLSAKQALVELERHFATPEPGRRTTVVLVDELDQMITRRQEVIYNFFNWPHTSHSRLIVVAVANTMDLPERELSGKVRSRLGANRIPFPSYTYQDLKHILEGRLGDLTFDVPAPQEDQPLSPMKSPTKSGLGTPKKAVKIIQQKVFEDRALERIARQVASVSGDARRALDIARRTVERVDQANRTRGGPPRPCSIADAGAAYNAMTRYGPAEFVRKLSQQQKVLLLAIAQCARKAGVAEIEIEHVFGWHFDFLRQTGITPTPSHEDLFGMVADLHGLRLVVSESAREDAFAKVRGLVEEGDLFGLLREDATLRNHIPKA